MIFVGTLRSPREEPAPAPGGRGTADTRAHSRSGPRPSLLAPVSSALVTALPGGEEGLRDTYLAVRHLVEVLIGHVDLE